ncbi:MAG: sigma 54-interacting transcriptional regulator [Vicinamibacterales bacterium]
MGEVGVGKPSVARLLHHLSRRSNRRFTAYPLVRSDEGLTSSGAEWTP